MPDIPQIMKVMGPPGTGKTTYLIRALARATKHFDPARIGAVSYTNAATEEIRTRAADKAEIDLNTAQNFRTIHSICFRLLNLSTDKIADEKIVEWNLDHPELTISTKIEYSEENVQDAFDPKYLQGQDAMQNWQAFQRMQVYRNRMIPEEKWDYLAQKLYAEWKRWTFVSDYFDYTGMLEKVLEERLKPDIDFLFIDEAQDLTKLQHEVLKMWGEGIPQIYIGDGDQCIYRFAGAVPETFINLKNDWEHGLAQSYRLPVAVHKYALRIIKQAYHRNDVPFKPTDKEGRVIKCKAPDLSLPGTHMILCRCNRELRDWREFLVENGEPWHNPYRAENLGWNPVLTKIWKAVGTYFRMKSGDKVSPSEMLAMTDPMIAQGEDTNFEKGMKGKLAMMKFESGTRFGMSDLAGLSVDGKNIFNNGFINYDKPIHRIFHLARRSAGNAGKILLKSVPKDRLPEPRVILGTIHSSKGTEADNIWVDLRTSRRCVKLLNDSRAGFDDETRVFYVACTRAKKNLGLMWDEQKFYADVPNPVAVPIKPKLIEWW